MPSSVLLTIASSDETTMAASCARRRSASESARSSTNVLTAATIDPRASAIGVDRDAHGKAGAIPALHHERDIAHRLARANGLRQQTRGEVLGDGRSAPELEGGLIGSLEAAIAIDDADRDRQHIDGLAVQRVDGEPRQVHCWAFLLERIRVT